MSEIAVERQSCHRWSWRRLLPLTTLLVGLGGLAAAALGRLSGLLGDWAFYFDVFSHLSGHLIGMVVASLLALLVPRRTIALLTLGALATLGLHTGLSQGGAILHSAEAAIERSGPLTGDLRVVSINTWHTNPDPAALVRYIEASQADVVVLAEFGPNKRHLLQHLKAQYPYQADCARDWYCSMAILSRRPWTEATASARIYRRQGDEVQMSPPAVEAVFETSSGPLTVIGSHLFRPIDSPRGHAREIGWLAGRARHALQRAEGASVIVAGDFNATPWSQSFRDFARLSGLQHMGRFLPSWPAGRRGLPQLAIDHLWVSPDLNVRRVGLGPDIASDHRPLGADITLAKGRMISPSREP